MKYQISADEITRRKRIMVLIIAISFAIATIILFFAMRDEPRLFFLALSVTGLICIIILIPNARRSFSFLRDSPVEVTSETVTLPYQNKLVQIPFHDIQDISVKNKPCGLLLTLRIKGVPKIVIVGYQNMQELIREIETKTKLSNSNKQTQAIAAQRGSA